MRKIFALALASSACAFVSEIVETVLVNGQDGKPVRINKADFDADQADGGEHKFSLHGTGEAEQGTQGVQVPIDGPPLAAPSAPHFAPQQGTGAPSPDIDPLKGAVAQSGPSPNQRLVTKRGKKFYVVDGSGADVKMDGVEPGGYATEEAAWKAIMDLPH